ncbi:TRAP transporter small permease [Chloroflexota bacterium]
MNSSLDALKPVFAALRPVTSPLWRAFELIAGIIDRSCQIFTVAMLAGMWGLLMVNAFARWTDLLPSGSIGWTIEITKYLVAWSIFVIMGPVTRNNENIRVTFLPEKVLGEKKAATFVYVFENIVALLLCIYLAKGSYDLIISTRDLGLMRPSSGGWEYPMWIVRSGIFVGFVLACIFYFERSVKWLLSFFTDRGILPVTGSPAPSSTGIEEVGPGHRAEMSDTPADKDFPSEEQA